MGMRPILRSVPPGAEDFKERPAVEPLVSAALLHGGDVAELSGGSGNLLDAEGEGLGARLRFSVL